LSGYERTRGRGKKKSRDGTAPLRLYVGIRYFRGSENAGTFDVEVDIDGTRVTDGRMFPTPSRKATDDFTIPPARGSHRLRARSKKANLAFETEFEIAKDAHFATLDLDYYPKDHEHSRKGHPHDQESAFSFQIQEKDFGWK
jgi:hypothetical protein